VRGPATGNGKAKQSPKKPKVGEKIYKGVSRAMERNNRGFRVRARERGKKNIAKGKEKRVVNPMGFSKKEKKRGFYPTNQRTGFDKNDKGRGPKKPIYGRTNAQPEPTKKFERGDLETKEKGGKPNPRGT